MPTTPANALDITQAGLVKFDGTATFTGVTTTQYDVLVGATANGISNIGPGTAGQVLQSGGNAANPFYSTATYPSTAGTTGNVLTSNGTNWTSAVPVVNIDLHTARFIVSAGGTSDGANYTTIQSAITAATSGSTVFIQPGTYTENLTLKAGVNLTAFESDGSLNGTGDVIILGTSTLTTAGSVTISGIQLQTNSAALLAVTGSAASVVNLMNCYLNCTNATGITFSSSSTSSAINLYDCFGDLATTGISYFTSTAIGVMNFYGGVYLNSGQSITPSTTSNRPISMYYVIFFSVLQATGGTLILIDSSINSVNGSSVVNAVGVSIAGSSTLHSIINCNVSGGTSSAVTVDAGCTLSMSNTLINSSNTNAVSGTGSLKYIALKFNGTSSKISVSTQSGGTLQGGLTQAPTGGFLGENIRASASSVALVTLTPKTICSISLTAGIWDISAISTTVCATSGNYSIMGISTATNALTGTVEGDNQTTLALATGTFSNIPNVIPAWRVTISATTSYFLVVSASFAGTAAASSRLSATRVG